MSDLQTALDAEDCYRKRTKRVVLKLAKCIASGKDEDILVALELLPVLTARLQLEQARARRRIARWYV